MKKLSTGISNFREIIENDYIYVDKTKTIYELIDDNFTCMLVKPKGFGKSLLISTMKEIFEGNKELFKGLYIYDKWDWTNKYNVIHLDFKKINYETPEKLEQSLYDFLVKIADKYEIELWGTLLNSNFSFLIEDIHKKTDKKVVVLIDGYDKPTIDSIENIELAKEILSDLFSFFTVLKASGKHLKFVFLTGVTKSFETSIFSGFNNVFDLTTHYQYPNICGFTQDEFESYYFEYINKFSKDKNIETRKLIDLINRWYGGYSWNGKDFLINPKSAFSFISTAKFDNYWFENSKTPFLIDLIKNNQEEVEELIQNKQTYVSDINNLEIERIDVNQFLLQNGFLSLKKEKRAKSLQTYYEVYIPNREVKKSLNEIIAK